MNRKLISRKSLRRFLRYIVMFFVVFILALYIPECKVSLSTAFILAVISTVVFCLLDMYFPLVIQ